METKKDKPVTWLNMRLTPREKARIIRLARGRGYTTKGFILDLVNQEEEKQNIRLEAQPGSFLDGIEDIIGSASGPGDLSTSPELFVKHPA
ncbi:MAG: hypothetical protein WD491_11785 [Balneolales bacterium]